MLALNPAADRRKLGHHKTNPFVCCAPASMPVEKLFQAFFRQPVRQYRPTAAYSVNRTSPGKL
jgi:hypothetical protein